MSTRYTALILCVLMLLSGCSAEAAETPPAAPPLPASDFSAAVPEDEHPGITADEHGGSLSPAEHSPAQENPALSSRPIPLENAYIQSVADSVIEKIITPGMDDTEKLRAAYEWIIRRTYFEEPVGLDIWRYRGDPCVSAPFVENRALSVLLWGLGECEDYAAAMVVLARRMGYEAEYVFGMTVSIHGEWVDHAWCAVKAGRLWYHLDPQLEDNIMRGGQIQNRYFMRDDISMSSDHLWGEGLIAARGGLTESQIMKIRRELPVPVCRGNSAPDPPAAFTKLPRPDRAAILRALDDERAAYTAKNGPLPDMELNTEPPMEIYDPDVY